MRFNDQCKRVLNVENIIVEEKNVLHFGVNLITLFQNNDRLTRYIDTSVASLPPIHLHFGKLSWEDRIKVRICCCKNWVIGVASQSLKWRFHVWKKPKIAWDQFKAVRRILQDLAPVLCEQRYRYILMTNAYFPHIRYLITNKYFKVLVNMHIDLIKLLI